MALTSPIVTSCWRWLTDPGVPHGSGCQSANVLAPIQIDLIKGNHQITGALVDQEVNPLAGRKSIRARFSASLELVKDLLSSVVHRLVVDHGTHRPKDMTSGRLSALGAAPRLSRPSP